MAWGMLKRGRAPRLRTKRSRALDNSDSFEDHTVSNPFHREVSVFEDHDKSGDWRVE